MNTDPTQLGLTGAEGHWGYNSSYASYLGQTGFNSAGAATNATTAAALGYGATASSAIAAPSGGAGENDSGAADGGEGSGEQHQEVSSEHIPTGNNNIRVLMRNNSFKFNSV